MDSKKTIQEFDITNTKNSAIESKIFIYKDIKKIVGAHFGDLVLDGTETINGFDGEGGEYSLSVDEFIKNVSSFGCWGFCEGNENIHIWYDEKVELKSLIHFLAHEKGHMNRPHHKDKEREEMKAELYGNTAVFAFEIAEVLYKRLRQN